MKNEGGKPTVSFKDRGMTLDVTKALELGRQVANLESIEKVSGIPKETIMIAV